MRYALQVAVCGICRKPVDLVSDCYRQNRVEGGLTHVLCIAVVMTDADDGPALTAAEMAETINNAADELCSKLCENAEHDEAPPPQQTCRQDGWIGREGYVISCTTDEPQDWYYDHSHAILDGAACPCRHETPADARTAHGQSVEG